MILWVSYHTLIFAGQALPVPLTVTVYKGMGTVWEILTHGIPMFNPGNIHTSNDIQWLKVLSQCLAILER